MPCSHSTCSKTTTPYSKQSLVSKELVGKDTAMNKHTITLSQIENQAGADFLGYVVNWRLMNIRVQEADLKAALERAGFSSHLPAPPSPQIGRASCRERV